MTEHAYVSIIVQWMSTYHSGP